MFNHRKSGLVDVGWTGSVLKYTRALVRDLDDNVELYGFFVGVGANARRKYKFSENGCLHGYLFHFDDEKHLDIRKHFFVIEKFLSARDPSVIKMTKDGSEFRPMYKPGAQESVPLCSSVQESALGFVRDCSQTGELAGAEPEVFLPKLKKYSQIPIPRWRAS